MTEKNIATKHDDTRGTLYIVATPIGNLGDISQRALDTLRNVACICAEDTRNTRKLLHHFGIQTPLQALHDHNEQARILQVQQRLDAGDSIALVSDAGTPLISDPGYHLVSQLGAAHYNIQTIPGASAIIAALSIAGLPTDRFCFEGFLPAKAAARNKVLQANLKEPRTQVYYESSHRIVNSVAALLAVYGSERQAVLARELTKLYEQVFRGTLGELATWISADPVHQKGEFVLMVAGHTQQTEGDEVQTDTETVLTTLLEELPVKQAASLAASITGRKKNDLYKQAMALKKR